MASTGQPARRGLLKEVATIGLDLAKTSVYFVGLDASGQVLTRRQYSKAKLVQVSAKLLAASAWRPAAAHIISAASCSPG